MMRIAVTVVLGAVVGGALGFSALFLVRHARSAPSAPPSDNPLRYAEVASTSESAPPAPNATSTEYVPILAYHIVRPSYPSDSRAVRDLALTPQTFDAELAHLRDAGYHVIGFHDLEAHFASSTPLPTKPIILSFDDGWGDQYKYAFPILEKYHDTATFFVFTNGINRPGFLSWDDLKTMLAAGMTVGDHSRSHPYFAHLTATSSLESEIVQTKQLLQAKLGVPITEFAYPFGQFNARVFAYVRRAGFKAARGDYWNGGIVSPARRFLLPALNAPTTTAAFDRVFP